MFTKNFYNVISSTLFGVFSPVKRTDGSSLSDFCATRYNTTGTSGYGRYYNAYMKQWASTINTEGVFFGTGTTAPTKDDYKPEAILGSSSISVAAPSAVTVNQTDDYVEAMVAFSITNKTTSAITISEIGCLGYVSINNGGTYGNADNPPYLAERQLLETPITLEAGEAESIQYRIRFPYGA